jgi:hypothetical protein
MPLWIFRQLSLDGDEDDEEDHGAITSWLKGIGGKKGTKVRGKFKGRLSGMETTHQAQWPPLWTTKLKGYDEVYELRFEVWNVQYRPLFFFGLHRAEITFVLSALEVGDEFDPKDAPDRAAQLIKDIRDGKLDTEDLDYLALA